ncbi:hypothetical protein MNEG_11682, partial [Monoraphidium neglectum]
QLASLGCIHIAPDLAPGGWPYDIRQMLSWAFEPADQGMLEELVARGRADARAWAAATGVGALAAARRGAAAGEGVGAAAATAPSATAGGGLVLP